MCVFVYTHFLCFSLSYRIPLTAFIPITRTHSLSSRSSLPEASIDWITARKKQGGRPSTLEIKLGEWWVGGVKEHPRSREPIVSAAKSINPLIDPPGPRYRFAYPSPLFFSSLHKPPPFPFTLFFFTSTLYLSLRSSRFEISSVGGWKFLFHFFFFISVN